MTGMGKVSTQTSNTMSMMFITIMRSGRLSVNALSCRAGGVLQKLETPCAQSSRACCHQCEKHDFVSIMLTKKAEIIHIDTAIRVAFAQY